MCPQRSCRFNLRSLAVILAIGMAIIALIARFAPLGAIVVVPFALMSLILAATMLVMLARASSLLA